MSIKFQRFEQPKEGQTLLLAINQPWKDPRKEENKIVAPLESEKGAFLPSWGQLFTMTGVLALVSTFQHLRRTGRW